MPTLPASMTAVGKACGLAIVNVLVISFALTFEIERKLLTVVIAAYAFWPALVLGYVLGKVAESTAAQRPRWRYVVLAFPACALVIALAAVFDTLHFVPHVRIPTLHYVPQACIPTLVAASILERTTRQPVLLPRAVGR